ncbi:MULTISPECIES: YlxQ family RNA-binding protein [Bacillaceae]|jgi:ribosomal protein L7Ae-like RNA K-turn-binding protein|uniref:YlxQ family RNA-binding protein n=1 Tax=Sutcliffiella horikoshii TaxID=79883 RepID=A0A5D4T4D5_9BACI|nr:MULTISPECIES: YlxQ family RNA-binding protein [Bacillaceae]KPB04402.1 50S ribosomal protein L7 [Bacillus sp. CHD6a]MEA3320146.1 YlxQ family RNA-binding protein [Bacillota bacterium]TYS70560.1 YlxQ family RNA-binding protein [Sutcliffiella horikoshii]
MNNQWLSIVGLATRARKTITGEELVIKEVRAGKAKLVLLASDASANTMKKLQDKCTYYNVPIRTVDDRYELGRAIGKDARVSVAILDEGFANKLLTMLD